MGSTKTRSWILVAELLVLFVIGTNTFAAPRRALIIGNDAYPSPYELPSCVNDAKAIAEWLKSVGYEPGEITLMTNANKATMLEGLEQLVSATRSIRHDQVVIYYSGHGTAIKDDNGDEGGNDKTDEALVAIEEPGDADDPEKFLIRDDEFDRYVRRISANTRQLVIMFDSCFSGGALKSGGIARQASRPKKRISEVALYRMMNPTGATTKGLRAEVPGPKSVPKSRPGSNGFYESKADSKGLVFLSAASEFEEASASAPGESLSLFTKAFLDVMNDVERDASTKTSLNDIHVSLVARLKGSQTPLLDVRGMSKNTALLPSLFLHPDRVNEQRTLSGILEALVFLPPSRQTAGWSVNATSRPERAVVIGSQYDLRVTPGKNGYLVVFMVETNGDVTFFYPNAFPIGRNNYMIAGKEVAIPWENSLRADPPAGVDRYYVYLLERNPFEGYRFDEGGALLVGRLDEIVRRRSGLRDVRQLLGIIENGAPNSGAPNTPFGSWARAVVTVRTKAR